MVEGLAYDVILGMEWLDCFNPIIDWQSRTVQVQGLNIPGCEWCIGSCRGVLLERNGAYCKACREYNVLVNVE